VKVLYASRGAVAPKVCVVALSVRQRAARLCVSKSHVVDVAVGVGRPNVAETVVC